MSLTLHDHLSLPSTLLHSMSDPPLVLSLFPSDPVVTEGDSFQVTCLALGLLYIQLSTMYITIVTHPHTAPGEVEYVCVKFVCYHYMWAGSVTAHYCMCMCVFEQCILHSVYGWLKGVCLADSAVVTVVSRPALLLTCARTKEGLELSQLFLPFAELKYTSQSILCDHKRVPTQHRDVGMLIP